MNISDVQAQLTGEDILSLINEFVNVEGLELKEVIIDNQISLKGSFTKGLSIDFEGSLDIEGVREGKVYGRFTRLKVMKLGFFRQIRSFALKTAFKQLPIKGIESNKDEIIIDINKILNPISFIKFNIKNVFIKGNSLNVEFENINISLKGELIKVEETEVREESEDTLSLPIEKVEDNYTYGRK